MQLSFSLLLFSALTVSANTYSQNFKFSISDENIEIGQVFNIIESESDYIFFYDVDVDISREVSVDVTKATINKLLSLVLRGANLEYDIRNRQVVISTSLPVLEQLVRDSTQIELDPPIEITGKVIDENKEGVPGVNIIIKGSSIGTITDVNGRYSIEIKDSKTILVFSYIGYVQQEVPVGNLSTIDVQLIVDITSLDEVVLTAQAKGQVAAINEQLSSLSIKNVVAADRIRSNPDANAAEAIGRLPGVSVTRRGGEASDIVIRGMDPQYNTILLNGVEIPSNKGTSRNASLAGISQYSLEGVEVFKSITPDMDANTVSGAVNLKLGTAQSGFHSSFMAQAGYNNQNSDFSNYKLHTNISDRFFEDKLGINFNLSKERVNRSTQLMTAGYTHESSDVLEGEFLPMYVTSINLNNITDYKNRTSGSLVVDYRFSPTSKIEFSSYFTSSPTDHLNVNKSFVPGTRYVGYGLHQNTGGNSQLLTNTLHGEHVAGIFHIDYGFSYSKSTKKDKWRNYGLWNKEGYDQDLDPDQEFRSLPLDQIINSATNIADEETLNNFGLPGTFGSDIIDDLKEEIYDARLNISIPFNISNNISGNIKFGGQYKHKERLRDADTRVWGSHPTIKLVSGTQTTDDGIDWTLPWVNINKDNNIAMGDMVGGEITDFLNGRYDFGLYPDINKANEIYDWWQELTQYYLEQGRDVWMPIFGQERMIGFLDPRPSVVNDNTVSEDYYAGYLMGEFKIGNKIHFIPGVRYENIHDDLYGWFVERRLNEGLEIPGWDTTATRSNSYLLPMAHLKIKPNDWLYLQFSYTNTLHRPNFNQIIPFEYVNNALAPWEYTAGVPSLNPEYWTNLDLMVAIRTNKIGLFSVNGFYKKVKDKIWNRLWTRLPSDEPIPHFMDDDVVNVNSWYNHEYPTYVRGFELEWQTNFWYLPGPFKYFTLTTNYSYINNESTYPFMEVDDVLVDVINGRPIYERQRSDSTYSGSMINQPNHLANISLGFNYKSLNIWLSYQYIGEITTGKAIMEEYDSYKSPFSRLGIQGKIEMPIKGMEVLFNLANITNTIEEHYIKAETRPMKIEGYGWTADLGLRYVFDK